MSIRLLAKDLYLAQKQVERLERALETAPADRRGCIGDDLRKARAHLRMLQGALDGQLGRRSHRQRRPGP